MQRTLFQTTRSPYARKVHIVLLEKRLPFEVSLVDLSQRTPEFVAASPLGKVPLLCDEDGSVVFDSTVIVEYLEDRYPEPRVLGTGTKERLLHRTFDELGDTIAEQAIALFFNQGNSAEWRTKSSQLLDKALAHSEALLGRGDAPREFGVGQASLLSALDYVVLRLGRERIDAHSALERWLLPFRSRASVLGSPPPVA